MFSKKFAGIGAVAALVGSALLPSVAFADPTHDSTPAPDKKAGVVIQKTILANEEINPAGDTYTFTIEKTPCADGTPASEAGCVTDVNDYPKLSSDSVSVTYAKGDATSATGKVKTVNFPLPDPAATPAPYSKAGVYVWTVKESQSGAAASHDVDYSDAKYRVKAYVGGNATDGFTYKAVTIAQDLNDAGQAVTENNKKEKLEFANRYKDVAPLVIDKTVVNDANRTEDANGEYSFTVAITEYPSNFTPTTAPTVTGALAGSVTGATAGTTSLSFKLKHGDSARIEGLPVGTKYTVQETNTGTIFSTEIKTTKTSSLSNTSPDETTVSGRTTAATALGDGGNLVNVTNEYDEVTPTGVVLAVLPYVLMIGIPLLAIVGYIALRRKMNF